VPTPARERAAVTEDFDAKQLSQLPPTVLFAMVFLLVGVGLEFGLRWLGHKARAHKWRRTKIFLYALKYQPILWSVIAAVKFATPPTWLAEISRFLGVDVVRWLITVTLALLLVRMATGGVQLLLQERAMASTTVLQSLVNFLALLIVLAVALNALGVQINALLVALAGSSVGLSLALRDPLANLFAGVQLATSSRFAPGEYIRLGSGEEGTVADVDVLTTTIRQSQGKLLFVPNATLVNATMTNYDQPEPELSFGVNVAVACDSDLQRVEQVALEVATEVLRDMPGGVSPWQPFIRYPQGLQDYVIRFSVWLRVQHYADQGPVGYEFARRLQERFLQEGIHMAPAFPAVPDSLAATGRAPADPSRS
jgi:small-conductance mechanosensitive channel